MLETHSVLYSSGGCSRPKLYISLQLGHPFNTSLKTFNETSTHGLGAFAITHLLHSAYLLRGEQSTFNQCFACVHSLAAASTNKSFPITDALTLARGCGMCQACWSHYLYPSVSMAPVLLATLNFMFTCQWCCTILSTAANALSCCRLLKVNSLPKASLAASPHKTKLDLVWNSVEQNT